MQIACTHRHEHTYSFMYMHAIVLVWQSEDNVLELVPSFHYVGPEGRTQVIRLGSKYLYLLN